MGELFSRQDTNPKKSLGLPIWLAVVFSLCIQVPMALGLGHAYDMKIFLATGALVGTGQNPYLAQNLTQLFHNPGFQSMTSIGYPPPWALWLGLAYLISFKIVPNLLLYLLVSKLPILMANILLALLVAKVLKEQHASPGNISFARNFLLFNPFLLLASAAWGQFDSVVAVITLAALLQIVSGKWLSSAMLLGLAITLKPIALPLILAGWLYWKRNDPRKTLPFLAACGATTAALSVIPFVIFHWDPTVLFQHWNAHFLMEGGMSFITVIQAFFLPHQMPATGSALGFVWVPALGIAASLLRKGITDLPDLLKKSVALILIFYLCRTWVSEPNILLLMPLVVLLVALGDLGHFARFVIWFVPLLFAVFNTSLFQLLFFIAPQVMDTLMNFASTYYVPRLILLAIFALAWLVSGWWMVIACMRPRRAEAHSR